MAVGMKTCSGKTTSWRFQINKAIGCVDHDFSSRNFSQLLFGRQSYTNLRQFCVEVQRGVHDVGARLPDEERKLVARRVQVVRQDGVVDGVQGVLGPNSIVKVMA